MSTGKATMTTIRVTERQRMAAQIEAQALLSAGLTPDPVILRIAAARPAPSPRATSGAATPITSG